VARQGFVGRLPERAALEQRLRAALDGAGQVVLVAGEPGVGKTRLAEEVMAAARDLGARVAAGRSTEDEGSPPYWPFLQVFRALDREPPAGMTLGDRDADGSARQRFQLLEAVADALVTTAAPDGLLVMIDDIQWLDSASLRLLTHLSVVLARSRLMVLVTYRDTETAGRPPLHAALAALARESSVTRLSLAGLTEAEVAEYLETITGWSVPASVASAIRRRTQGNPFFVGELGRVLATSTDGQLPDGVRDAVRDRLARLSASCRRVVSSAAVLGFEVDPVALASASRLDLRDVLAALDEAADAGIVGGGRRFAHDLVREAARLELPTAERLALHQRMADHLAGCGDADVRVAEIAHHHLESLPAGDATVALAWAERAAARACAQHAWEEAAALYGRALALTRDAIGPHRRCRLLLAMAGAQVRSFGVADACDTLAEAARIAREIGDPTSIAQAALTMEGFSDYEWDETGRRLCDEALDGLPDGDSAMRARLLALRVSVSIWEDMDNRTRSAEALAMAERVGDRYAIREALRARQIALSGPDGVRERLALGKRMVAFGADGDDDTVLWGRLWRFDALVQLGDLDAAEAELPPIAAEAHRLRSPMPAWHVARCRAAIAGARGRFDEAIALALEAERLARRAGIGGPLLPSQAMLVLYRLLVGAPGQFPHERTNLVGHPAATGFASSIYVFWLLATGQRERARQIYRTMPAPTDVPPMVLLPALAWMIDFAAEFDDRKRAADCYTLLSPYADLVVCGGAGVVTVIGTVRQALGLAAATMGRLDDAVRHLRSGVELAERIGMPPAVAATTYELARVLARRQRPGDRDEASALATSAAAQAQRLDLRPIEARARDLHASLTAVPVGNGRLTRREDEIAILVSRGLTNRQIAAAAHISERTVETHVQHILEKLRFTGRAQIAAWEAAGRPD
jgi:DNA-binding CsgD family transcriptional regulator